jgi:hypothetical protein
MRVELFEDDFYEIVVMGLKKLKIELWYEKDEIQSPFFT